VADKLRELETLRSRVEELNRRKKELEQRLRHLPTDSLKARLLENVKVGGKGVKFVEN
jgi:predicted RNase H-like nuclease (RuvC/YqgF family)